MDAKSLKAVASTSERASMIFATVEEAIFSSQPSSLGFPGEKTQGCYYPGDHKLSPDENSQVSRCLERNNVLPENTRLQKVFENDRAIYQVLQASVEQEKNSQRTIEMPDSKGCIRIDGGDHCEELTAICDYLDEAGKYAANHVSNGSSSSISIAFDPATSSPTRRPRSLGSRTLIRQWRISSGSWSRIAILTESEQNSRVW